MKDLTKKNIAVKVTAKNVNSLKKLFDMFPNEVFAARLSEIKEGNFIYINGFNQWVSVSPKFANVVGIGITLIGSKQLRTILAKEHLKVGDVVVCSTPNIQGKFALIISSIEDDCIRFSNRYDVEDGKFHKTSGTYRFKFIRRYANPQEVELINRFQEDKDAELEMVSGWYTNEDSSNCICYYNFEDNHVFGYSVLRHWSNSMPNVFKKVNLRPSTEEEIQSALVQRTLELGHKVYPSYSYYSYDDELYAREDLSPSGTFNGVTLYSNGHFKEVHSTDEIPVIDTHAEVKAAFEKGAKVEVSYPSDNVWQSVTEPKWFKDLQYRLAPEPVAEVNPYSELKEAYAKGAKIEYKSGGTWKPAGTPSWNPSYDYRLAEDSPAGKWCEFWDDDVDDKTVCKYSEPCDASTYPHKDSTGRYWRYYSVLPDNFQELLNTL